MKRYLLVLILIAVPLFGYGKYVVAGNSVEETRIVVEKFQKIPAHILFCFHDKWDNDTASTMPVMQSFLSNKMLRLFAWIQCETPSYLRPLDRERSYYWDFRYGTKAQGGSDNVKNIRIQPAQVRSGGRIMIQVLWDDGDIKDTWARYTLIHENGEWKIDDIALKGYKTEMEEFLPSTKSLKTELQATYKRAEAKCLQDPKCKTKMRR